LSTLSVELADAPPGNNSRERVSKWLQQHYFEIADAEQKYSVDRRAIAGAIAWEALENKWRTTMFGIARFVGPGKVHFKEYYLLKEGNPVARQVEMMRGYLGGGILSMQERRKKLEEPKTSITYIAAIMKAYADQASDAGRNISDPAILATFFNGVKDRETGKQVELSIFGEEERLKMVAFEYIERRGGPNANLQPGPMGVWINNNMAFLEAAVGRPGEAGFSIVRDDRSDAVNSFVSTDTISLHVELSAAISPDLANTTSWKVIGMSLDSGNGMPSQLLDSRTFSFKPNPMNRPTTGSRQPNDPIKYDVEATIQGNIAKFSLVQDERDIIRQEYIDFGAPQIPSRDNLITPANTSLNTGNYTLILDEGMLAVLKDVTQRYNRLNTGMISISSAYRNPRRNIEVGSLHPITSKHVWGSALDLVVSPANASTWQHLHQAGSEGGYTSICQSGNQNVDCSDPTVDHVVIQW
jgi:hypothetical protein